MSNQVSIGQIGQSLTNPTDRTLVEVEVGGQSYKMELGALAAFLQARTPSEPQAATPYWINFPDYTLDSQAQTVALNAGGRYFEEGQEQTAAARTLSYASIQTAGYQRFDAIVFNLTTNQYELIAGEEGQEPTTPAYDERTALRVTYILVDDDGGGLQTPPNDHVQNTDTFLDFGGTHQVSAQELRDLVDNPSSGGSGHTQNTDQSLDQGGANEISAAQAKEAYDKRHDQNSDTKLAEGTADEVSAAELRTLADNPPTASQPDKLRFTFFSDLDTVSGEATLKGPKTVSDEYHSSNLSGVSFQVKLDASSSFTAQADTAALNNWIAANVTDAATLWQIYEVATYSGTGAASSTLVF